MKVWFFSEKWKSSSGWKNTYYAVIEKDCHMTYGRNLAEAIYMAHDMIACLKEDFENENIKPIKNYEEPFEYLNDGIFEIDSRNFYIGSLDIDVDLFPYNGWLCGWRRKDDKAPNTKQHMRVEMLRRAFQLSYKNFKLNA